VAQITTKGQSKDSSNSPKSGYGEDASADPHVFIVASHTPYEPSNGTLRTTQGEDEEDVADISCLQYFSRISILPDFQDDAKRYLLDSVYLRIMQQI